MPIKLVRSPNTGRYYPVNIAGELPTDEEKDRIKNYITQRERGVPSVDSQIESETAYKPRSGIFGAIDVSTDLIGAHLASAMQGLGESTGLEGMANYFGDISESYTDSAAQKSEGLTRLKEVEGVGTAAKFAGEALGQAGPQMGLAMGAGAIAGGAAALISAPLVAPAALIGTFAMTVPLLLGANRERQKEADIAAGRKVEVNEGAALLATLPQALMETFGLKFTL